MKKVSLLEESNPNEIQKLAGILWCNPPVGCHGQTDPIEIHAIIMLTLGFPGLQ
jgi:hypothetical protein